MHLLSSLKVAIYDMFTDGIKVLEANSGWERAVNLAGKIGVKSRRFISETSSVSTRVAQSTIFF